MNRIDFEQKIESIVIESVQKCIGKIDDSSCDLGVYLQIPKDPSNGDLTTNIAMLLAKVLKKSPLTIAEEVISVINQNSEFNKIKFMISKMEIKSGFINFWFSDEYYSGLLLDIKRKGPDYGKSSLGENENVNLEYVSANPTGPLTIAHGRQAAIGDALARILRFSGFRVTSEYYLNDFGRQIKLLGESVAVRYQNLFGKEKDMPEDGYVGLYIEDIAKEIRDKSGDVYLQENDVNTKSFKDYAVEYMMKLIEKDLEDFGVEFDVWTPQSGIENRQEVQKALAILEKNGYIYEKDGAKWFESTKFEDDKDRVVVKSDGTFTYLAPDIAYHLDKYERNFSRLIDLLGPDHHGYINRMKAAVQAFGKKHESLDILIVQLVTLLRGGETVSMSTRRGEFISLRELLDELGKDVTRFFFLSRRLNTHLDFDIEVAKKESAENPVYYMQYAHARICSIKKFSNKNFLKLFFTKLSLKELKEKQEKQLIRKLAEFPLVVISSADSLEPNKLIVYLNDLAKLFHSFYTECRVVSSNTVLSKARLYLVECVQITLANGLNLLNITLPEKM